MVERRLPWVGGCAAERRGTIEEKPKIKTLQRDVDVHARGVTLDLWRHAPVRAPLALPSKAGPHAARVHGSRLESTGPVAGMPLVH